MIVTAATKTKFQKINADIYKWPIPFNCRKHVARLLIFICINYNKVRLLFYFHIFLKAFLIFIRIINGHKSTFLLRYEAHNYHTIMLRIRQQQDVLLVFIWNKYFFLYIIKNSKLFWIIRFSTLKIRIKHIKCFMNEAIIQLSFHS